MWQKIKNVLYIITRSSNDPVAMSLAVRGVLVWLVALVIQWAPVACMLIVALCIDTSQLNPLVDVITNIVKTALELVADGLIAYGILRKIYYGRIVHPAAGEVG